MIDVTKKKNVFLPALPGVRKEEEKKVFRRIQKFAGQKDKREKSNKCRKKEETVKQRVSKLSKIRKKEGKKARHLFDL